MIWQDTALYRSDVQAVSSDLGLALCNGYLSLLVGSGASSRLGLPSWPTLVSNCLNSVGLPATGVTRDSSFAELIRKAMEFRRACASYDDYLAKSKAALYSGMTARTPANLTNLLVALGSLMMGSRRGRIREVWTLNFDDVIEWYLRINGFIAQSVSAIPTLLSDPDVIVYHPHGYLPLDAKHGSSSKTIVFDEESYAQHAFGKSKHWADAMSQALKTKVFLVVGMSWTDLLVKQLFIAARNDIADRPTAFWMFGPDAKSEDMDDCANYDIVPVQFSSFDDYIPFLLSICEVASERMQESVGGSP